jgi:hypothetical protein
MHDEQRHEAVDDNQRTNPGETMSLDCRGGIKGIVSRHPEMFAPFGDNHQRELTRCSGGPTTEAITNPPQLAR